MISWHPLDFMPHSWSARECKYGQTSSPVLVNELSQFKVRVSKRGEFVEEGSGRNSLKSPALCLAELGAAIVRRFPNQPLSAGEIVSSGTLDGRPSCRQRRCLDRRGRWITAAAVDAYSPIAACRTASSLAARFRSWPALSCYTLYTLGQQRFQFLDSLLEFAHVAGCRLCFRGRPRLVSL